jgi:hypothetical protein
MLSLAVNALHLYNNIFWLKLNDILYSRENSDPLGGCEQIIRIFSLFQVSIAYVES